MAIGGIDLQRKIGPLKTWQWGAGVVLLGAGYLWWRSRQAASSSSATGTGGGDLTGASSTDIPDFSTGYDAGYSAGLNGTGTYPSPPPTSTPTSGTVGPMAHTQICQNNVRDPAGKNHPRICGYGMWVTTAQGGQSWHPATYLPAPPGGTPTTTLTSATGQVAQAATSPNAASLSPALGQPPSSALAPIPTGQQVSYPTPVAA